MKPDGLAAFNDKVDESWNAIASLISETNPFLTKETLEVAKKSFYERHLNQKRRLLAELLAENPDLTDELGKYISDENWNMKMSYALCLDAETQAAILREWAKKVGK